MADYVPNSDAELQAWLGNFVTVLNANLAQVGLAAGDLTPLTGTQTNFTTAVTDQIAKEATFRQAVQTKKTRHSQLMAVLRPMVRRINGHPGMSDGLRAQLGLTVPDRTPTRKQVGPEIPGMFLETKPGQVVVHFGTDPVNERINGKPSWALGCNIYRKKTGDPTYSLVAFDTASPFVDSVSGAAANYSYKVAYRTTRATEEGALSPEQTVAAGA